MKARHFVTGHQPIGYIPTLIVVSKSLVANSCIEDRGFRGTVRPLAVPPCQISLRMFSEPLKRSPGGDYQFCFTATQEPLSDKGADSCNLR